MTRSTPHRSNESLPYPRPRHRQNFALFPLAAILLLTLVGVTRLTGAQTTNPPSENPTTPPGTPAEHQPPRQTIAIEPEWTCNGIDRPFMVRITSQKRVDSLELALMSHNGSALIEPVPVRVGRQDLAELIPDIWNLRRTAYVQVLSYERPVGAALVVQPMLTRLIPTTEPALRPNNTPFTRITGFQLPDDLLTDEEKEKRETAPDPMTWLNSFFATKADRRAMTGIRAWVDHDVLLETTAGAILIALRPDEAPNTVWNFMELCKQGYYNDVAFHRIVPYDRDGRPFVIQGGDPSATGEGEPGYWLPFEPSRLPHDFGVISMARTDIPDSAGGQFFICLSKEGTARLDGQYCAFGTAVAGTETILNIADTPLRDVAKGIAEVPPIVTAAILIPAPPHYPRTGRPDRPVAETQNDANANTPEPNLPKGRISR